LGVVFLGLEFHEYGQLIDEGLFPGAGFDRRAFTQTPLDGRSVELFYCLFFFMTGLHAFHMIVGVALVIGMAITVRHAQDVARSRNLLENVGLYWHFVDIVWVFLFPLFYLIEA
jgi:cytochrome c oxidase subunit 3